MRWYPHGNLKNDSTSFSLTLELEKQTSQPQPRERERERELRGMKRSRFWNGTDERTCVSSWTRKPFTFCIKVSAECIGMGATKGT